MPRLLCRQLQLKRMLNGTDVTVRRAAGSDKMNYRHKRVQLQSVSQAVRQSVKWAGRSCEFPKRVATLYRRWSTNPTPTSVGQTPD